MTGGGTIKRVIGALKDSTMVGLVKLSSENKVLDVAILKATNHDEVLPKEKHVKTIFAAISASSPRNDVAYCINGLTRRLAKTHNWTVALKILIVIHRALREVDTSFLCELTSYNRGRGLTLNLSNFKDESSPHAWNYSAWIRLYALYLEECIACFRSLTYDVQRSGSKIKFLDTSDLVEQLPAMQQLLFHLLGCKPQGAALNNSLIHSALSIVASEGVKLYDAITDGIVILADKYFDMERDEAAAALEIYKKSLSQSEALSEFFKICKSLEFGREQKFVKIQKPPPLFLTAMEDYLREVSDGRSVASESLLLEPPKSGRSEMEFTHDPSDASAYFTSDHSAASRRASWELDLLKTSIYEDKLGCQPGTLALNGDKGSVSGMKQNDARQLSYNPFESARYASTSGNGKSHTLQMQAGQLDPSTSNDDKVLGRGMNQSGGRQLGYNPFESARYECLSGNGLPQINWQMASSDYNSTSPFGREFMEGR